MRLVIQSASGGAQIQGWLLDQPRYVTFVQADKTTGLMAANAVVAPFPAVVAEVHVEPGQAVDGADPIVVIEAMKMLHTLTAGGPGVVADVRVAPGDQVETNQILITFETPEETEDA